MNRTEYQELRRVQRTFLSFAREVVANSDLFLHCVRWMDAEYAPRRAAIDALPCSRPGAGLTTQLGMIRALPEQRAQRIQWQRMRRYFRQPCPLPR